MQRLFSPWRLLCIAIPALVLAGMPFAAMAGDVPLPEIPQARAKVSATQGCVEPTQEMRKNHMNHILHQRDRTVHEGIRTRQYSLEECINCHVTPGADGAIPSADSHEHFCNSCHTYAAVHIDCFECHADRPVNATEHNLPPQIIPPPRVQTDTKPVALLPATHRSLTTESTKND